MFCVYEHRRKDTGEVFYVGKGKANRVSDTKNRNSDWSSVVLQVGFYPNVIFETDCEDLALFVEQEYIHKCRVMNVAIVNKTSGGQGISGYRHTQKSKEKMRESRIGKPGHPHSEESKQKIREANTGIVFTEERKRKIAEKAKGREMPDHVKALLKEKNKNFRHAPEMIEHLRQVNIGRKHKPETIKKMRLIQQNMPKKICPHCGKEASATNAVRWHFDNCKHKEKQNG